MACIDGTFECPRVYLDSGFHLPESHSHPLIVLHFTYLLANIYIDSSYLDSERGYDHFAIQAWRECLAYLRRCGLWWCIFHIRAGRYGDAGWRRWIPRNRQVGKWKPHRPCKYLQPVELWMDDATHEGMYSSFFWLWQHPYGNNSWARPNISRRKTCTCSYLPMSLLT